MIQIKEKEEEEKNRKIINQKPTFEEGRIIPIVPCSIAHKWKHKANKYMIEGKLTNE